jgi:CDP-glucose 4,6-dehydratase
MSKDYSSGMKNLLGQGLRELPGPLLLTGHTGFKGTWMTFLLENLEIPVVGYSLQAEKGSLYDRAERQGAIPEKFADIRDYDALENFIDEHKPSTIIHMAAQPLVLKSYENPRETFEVNVMGTVNLLDIAFKKNFIKVIIVVTTDKVYKNDNLGQAFLETDALEGKDPYSSSKVGTEAVVTAWQQIAKVCGGPKIVSVRAGNIIGGGDFAENRIIPDFVRSILNDSTLEIRNPKSTRPWLYILDSLRGYISVIDSVLSGKDFKAFNFGPTEATLTVQELINLANGVWPIKEQRLVLNSHETNSKEANNLVLGTSFAFRNLGWTPKIDQEDLVKLTITWWKRLVIENKKPAELCRLEIKAYFEKMNGI